MDRKNVRETLGFYWQGESYQHPDNGRMLAAKMAKPQQVGVPASEASVLIGLLSAIAKTTTG